MKIFKGKISRYIAFLVFGIVIIILALVVYQERQEILSFPWKVNIWYILAASFFHSAALGVTFIVWSMMLHRFSGFNNRWENFKIYYLSSLAKRVPTSLPYIGSRIGLYAVNDVKAPLILNCVLLENILITISGVIVFLSLLPVYSVINTKLVAPISTIGIILILISLGRPQIFIEVTNWILKKLKKDGIQIKITRNDLLKWVGVYFFSWIFAGISFNFLLRGLGKFTYPPFIDVMGISSAFTLVGLISMVFPGGFGMKEITAGAMLTPWMPFATGLIITIANRIMQTIDDLFWSAFALLIARMRDKTNQHKNHNTKGLLK